MTINLQFILHVAKLIPVFKRGQNKTDIKLYRDGNMLF